MKSLSERAELVARQQALAAIIEALVRSGYKSLDAQAQALGLCRSTAWTVIKHKHKVGRLHLSTARKMLASPALPSQVRAAVEAYLGSIQNEGAPAKGSNPSQSPNSARGIGGDPVAPINSKSVRRTEAITAA